MPDYAGAVAAIKSRLTTLWVDGSGNPLNPIAFANKRPEPPFPSIDPATGNPQPVLICEVIGTRGAPYSFGNLGNRFFIYEGLIVLHALVQIDEGPDRATQLAVSAAEIFRTATFYQDANGSYVRTIAPNPPDGGGSAQFEGVDVGNLFRVSTTIPFQYFHRA